MQCYALSHELMSRYPEHQVEVIDFEYLRKHNMYKAPMKIFLSVLSIISNIKDFSLI